VAELSQEMVERRLLRVTASPTPVHIDGLPGLGFVPLDSAARGRAARAYSEELMRLFRDGYPSRRVIERQVREIALANGVDPDAWKKRQAIQAKLLQMPDHLRGPVDQLTDEEVALLPPEEQERRRQQVEERGREIAEWLEANLGEEERRALEDAATLDAWYDDLVKGTAEHLAEIWRANVEIAWAARRLEEPAKPYFDGPDAVARLPERTLARLYAEWRAFRDGLPADFFSPSS